jgi:hypothetical protein
MTSRPTISISSWFVGPPDRRLRILSSSRTGSRRRELPAAPPDHESANADDLAAVLNHLDLLGI